QTSGSGRNVPSDPVRHVIERLSGMHVAIVEDQRIRHGAGRRTTPIDLRRTSRRLGRARVLLWNIAAVAVTGHREFQWRRNRRAASLVLSVSGTSGQRQGSRENGERSHVLISPICPYSSRAKSLCSRRP